MNRINNQPIGVFDSGVGGLSVLREISKQSPQENLIYIADQIHVPYGDRTKDQVLGYARGIVRFLIAEGAKLIVVACNTASAAALAELREIYPDLPFVGMEPAVKPAAEGTSSGVVGVLATPATFQGDLYSSTVERFAQGVRVLQHTCPELVELIESGQIDSPQTRDILKSALTPMLDQGIDKVVLGCTHYPFVIPIIQDIVGDGVLVIDPAPAVARQTHRLLEQHQIQGEQVNGSIEFLTTGDPGQFARNIQELIDLTNQVEKLDWEAGDLSRNP